MPLYEYECDSCGARFERIQKFTDPPPEACPKCGGPVHKLLSSPAIQFKGSGFYITDYGRKGESEASTSKPAGKSSDAGEATGSAGSAGSKDAPAKDAAPKETSAPKDAPAAKT